MYSVFTKINSEMKAVVKFETELNSVQTKLFHTDGSCLHMSKMHLKAQKQISIPFMNPLHTYSPFLYSAGHAIVSEQIRQL
jgi:hypothetical protein